MKTQEFWKIYQTKHVQDFIGKCILMDCPVGSDCGILKMGLFQDENENWCYERSVERSNHGTRTVFDSEEDAVKHIIRQIEYYVGIKF